MLAIVPVIIGSHFTKQWAADTLPFFGNLWSEPELSEDEKWALEQLEKKKNHVPKRIKLSNTEEKNAVIEDIEEKVDKDRFAPRIKI